MTSKFSRQSFLGKGAQEQIASARIGILGLGGGGSHVVQQLAHLGVLNFRLFDPDAIEETNLNRTVGATADDIHAHRLKVDIGRRLVLGVSPAARVETYSQKWQERLKELKGCDIIFGCVDGFIQRRDTEAFTRRYLIPYIDVGMDVHRINDAPPRMAGQVILSMPGYPCMQCIDFLNEKVLNREGARYGDAGANPQVVWCNGVLASIAVGIAVDLITNWTNSLRGVVFLSYDGNANTIAPDNRLRYLQLVNCPHYPLINVGEPRFKPL